MKTKQQVYEELKRELPIEDIKVKQRLDRAFKDVLGYGYEIKEMYRLNNEKGEKEYKVEKLSTAPMAANPVDSTYYVTVRMCTCPDYVDGGARAGLCKHRIAIMAWERMHR